MNAASWPNPVFVIAEVGSVHDGSLGNALKLIEAAAECGADAVKFQTHIASAETVRDAPLPPYFKGEPRFEYFERTAFTEEQWCNLKAHAGAVGIEFMSSPFSIEAVELLERVGVERYKVPSGEVTNLLLLEAIASTRKPVIVSSGMSSWDELDEAVAAIRRYHHGVTVLQCTSEYPCPYERVGLGLMQAMGQRYGLPMGLSDHTMTVFAPIAAATLGASVVEKHFAFSRAMYGSDAAHSLEPSDFRQMVDGIRAVEAMLGSSPEKDATPYAEMKRIFEKSLVATRPVRAGETLTADSLGVKKPGDGIPARRFAEAIGRKVRRDLLADELLSERDVDWAPAVTALPGKAAGAKGRNG